MRKLMCLALIAGFTTLAWADEITLKIEGMSCPQGCVKRVETALSKVKGVTDKKVEVGSAKITYNAKKTSKADLVKAIEKTGFTVVK
jgi:periplasmic mercuric ion binding protein